MTNADKSPDEAIYYSEEQLLDEIKSEWQASGDHEVPASILEELLLQRMGVEPKVAMILVMRFGEFSKTANLVYAIEAFLICAENGIPIRPWITTALSPGFRKWHEKLGHETLDKCLGLARGRGNNPSAYQQVLKQDLEHDLMRELWHLRSLFGLSIEDAAEAICERMAFSDWNNTDYKSLVARRPRSPEQEMSATEYPNFSPETLIDKYQRDWRKIWEYSASGNDKERNSVRPPPKFSQSEIETLISQYPDWIQKKLQ